jgi:hypothetical protein
VGIIVVGLIVIAIVLSLLLESRKAHGPVVEPKLNENLRVAIVTLQDAASRGDSRAWVLAHAALSDRLVEWIDDFTETASLDTVFEIKDEEVCEGCTLLPRAARLLSDPVPRAVVLNMTQLDKDRMELRKIPWTLINGFVPAFERLCDRYVDPATGKLRMAKPD